MQLEKFDSVMKLYSGSYTKVAILDLDFSLKWSNRSEFFGEDFCLITHTYQLIDFPVRNETIISLRLGGELFAAKLLPYREENEVYAYVLFVYSLEEVSQMMVCSPLQDKINTVMRISQSNIGNIIGIATILEEKLQNEQGRLISHQISSACKLLSQLLNLSQYCDLETSLKGREIIDITSVMETIHSESAAMLATVEREIIYSAPEESRYIKIDGKQFTLVFMNLLQNSVLYSEPKSPIKLTLTYADGKALINLSNCGRSVVEMPKELRPGLGIPITKKLITHNNGTISFDKKPDGGMDVNISLPLYTDESEGEFLSANYKSYAGERFKPIHLLLGEAVEKELHEYL